MRRIGSAKGRQITPRTSLARCGQQAPDWQLYQRRANHP